MLCNGELPGIPAPSHLVMSCWQCDTGHRGNIYNTEISKGYNQDLCHPQDSSSPCIGTLWHSF